MTGMDTRVGTPNEHLAKGAEEISSPMYATAVGLVIKGFENSDLSKVRTDYTETPTEQKIKTTANGGFFSSFFEKTKSFFEDDNNRNS
jgi:cell division protein FtsA